MNILKRIFQKKNKTINIQSVPLKELSMKYVYEAIVNHLSMKTTGALLLTGDWGSGKTYHVKNEIFPHIENETEFIPLIVSLYGVSNKNDIAQKVLFSYFDKKGKDSNISTGNIAKNLQNFSDAIPLVKKYINIEKLITGTGDNIFRFLPHDKLLICFDDLERISDEINVDDFLGIVNELVENKGSKVLIIANWKEVKGGETFKEKTIEKTIYFTPDISTILDSIIETYTNEDFKDYLKENKDFLLKTLNPKTDNESDTKELKKQFSNIRTIKFAIEHFKYPFEILKRKKDLKDDLIKNQLKSIWLFILSISIEFRKSENITFEERKNLDNQTTSFSDFDFSDFDFGNSSESDTEKEPADDEWSYSNKFKELYYGRLSEQYIFHPEIYDLITSSKKIIAKNLFKNLEDSFKVKEGKIHPAHELLNRFMHGYWKFTNEEFKINLEKLLDYAEKGELLDIISYLNAGVYLLGFVDLFDSDKAIIYTKLKKGLDTFLSKVTPNYMMKNQLEMVSGNFKEENLQKLISFIEEKIKIIEKENDKKEVERLSNLIFSDASSFVKEFIPGDLTIRTPDKAIFHELDENKVKESVSKWDGTAIMDMTSFLKLRYLDTGFSDRLIEELQFLKNIEDGIKLANQGDKTLSNHLLKTQLMPRIEECKNRLEQHKNALQQ